MVWGGVSTALRSIPIPPTLYEGGLGCFSVRQTLNLPGGELSVSEPPGGTQRRGTEVLDRRKLARERACPAKTLQAETAMPCRQLNNKNPKPATQVLRTPALGLWPACQPEP